MEGERRWKEYEGKWRKEGEEMKTKKKHKKEGKKKQGGWEQGNGEREEKNTRISEGGKIRRKL